jgi:natural product precursor
MKQLEKMFLGEKVDLLNDQEMKLLVGGSICYWESPYDSGCTASPVVAAFMGTTHWCCNNDEAINVCDTE